MHRAAVFHQVIESPDAPADIDGFNLGCCLKSVALPLGQIGHGNADVTGKYESVCSSVKLDVPCLLFCFVMFKICAMTLLDSVDDITSIWHQ